MLLPEAPRRGEIHFVLAKSLPYDRRLQIALALLIVGVLLQALVHPLLGLVLLLAASLLTIVRGYTNRPDALARNAKREWRAGDKVQLEKILDIARKSKRWDETAIDITCATGFATLLLAGLAAASLAVLVSLVGGAWYGPVVLMDAAVLLLPHWVTGVRSILKNAPLTVKVENLLQIYTQWENEAQGDEAMAVQIQVAALGEEQEIPTDAKLVLRLPPLGDAFLGVQIQVALNNVQGKDYPYVYCVLVARPVLELRTRLSPAPPAEIVTEWKTDEDMDLLIIRQKTTKSSGYHTNPTAVAGLFAFAHGEARKLLAGTPPTAAP